MGTRSLLFIILISTFMYFASETNKRCKPNRRCFVEKIEKSSDTKKNPDQLKFAALRSVNMHFVSYGIIKIYPRHAIIPFPFSIDLILYF